MGMEAAREAERVEKERNDKEKEKADKASEREKRRRAKEDKEQREKEKMEMTAARHGLGLDSLRKGELGLESLRQGLGLESTPSSAKNTPRRSSLFEAARKIVEDRKLKELGVAGSERSEGMSEGSGRYHYAMITPPPRTVPLIIPITVPLTIPHSYTTLSIVRILKLHPLNLR